MQLEVYLIYMLNSFIFSKNIKNPGFSILNKNYNNYVSINEFQNLLQIEQNIFKKPVLRNLIFNRPN